jgi:hypothetical protein
VTYDDVTGTLRERTVKAMRDPGLAANLRTAGTAWDAGPGRFRQQ